MDPPSPPELRKPAHFWQQHAQRPQNTSDLLRLHIWKHNPKGAAALALGDSRV